MTLHRLSSGDERAGFLIYTSDNGGRHHHHIGRLASSRLGILVCFSAVKPTQTWVCLTLHGCVVPRRR